MSELNIKKQIYSMHHLERKILPLVKLETAQKICKNSDGLSIAETITGLNMLIEKNLVIPQVLEYDYIALDKLGLKFVNDDLPEVKILKAILDKPKKISEINMEKEVINSVIGFIRQKELCSITNKEKELQLSSNELTKTYIDNNRNRLFLFEKPINEKLLTKEQTELYEVFKQRKGFLKKVKQKDTRYTLSLKGEEIAKELIRKYPNLDLIDTLTTDMIKYDTWQNKEFRHYNINAKTSISNIGRRHPMHESNNILSNIFVEMGFKEMSGPMVESAFWNMDIMWIPQDHPAREEQDTFYLNGEAEIPCELAEKVKQMHEKGLNKSHTLEGEWSIDIAKKRLLRTHSTATSFRQLYELSKKYKEGEDINGKYFYVANNFRNEAIDVTHLAEFFQAEGFIIGDDLSLANLMGFIKEYYAKLGIDKIRFKPTFNPYTEPSMEAHYYDPQMNKWYALINSGIFRKETLKPLGLENKSIIAWGMGASRIATLLAGKNSMRELTGYTCDFEWLKTRKTMRREIIR